ncbi:hypothetical protein TNCV_827021 [Trichonephila clavipes]|nr:hypothetical protein TNCV_827021 [Trichonephila clavipes]
MESRHPCSPRVKKFKTLISATKVLPTIFWDASGVLYMAFLTKGLTVNSDRVHKHRIQWKKLKLTMVPQPRLGTIGLLVVPKIQGDVERSTFFNRCQRSGSHAQMDKQPTRIFLHGRNEEMDRKIE